jgi:hypothetical protein
MRIQFRETMGGTLRDEGGVERQVDFQVVARSEGRGFFTLEGIGHAAPWAAECPAQGSLAIGPFLRFIRYTVRLTATGGKSYVLHGEKLPTLLSPVSSMTDMPTRLEDEQGKVLATGSLRFNLADLPDFLGSWLPLPLPASGKLLQARRMLLARSATKDA